MLAGVYRLPSSRVKQSPRCFVSLDSLTLDVGTDMLASTYQNTVRNVQEGLSYTAAEVRYLYVSSKGSSMCSPNTVIGAVTFPETSYSN
jgi:hypothetical protein